MTETVNLVYIGAKPEKRDTTYGSGLVFPAGEAIPVPTEFVPKLLKHKDVWVKESDYAAVKKQQAADAKAAEEAAIAAEAALKAKLEAESLEVETYGDLGKLTSAKLKTIVESEGLSLSINPGETVKDFAYRVRDALKAKGAVAE